MTHIPEDVTVRSVRPTDLAALAGFNRRSQPNDAVSRRDLAVRRQPLSTGMLLQHWLSFDENRQTWVAVDRSQGSKRIVGLASAQADGPIWEIDRLIVASDAGPHVLQRLLSYVSAVGSENGIQKLFLRLLDGSDLIDSARSTGFHVYSTETLYSRQTLESVPPAPGRDSHIRAKANRDNHAVFQLYCEAVPAAIRQAEAMVFAEWQHLYSRRPGTLRRREHVLEMNDTVSGWLRTYSRGQAGYLEVLVAPAAEASLESLIDAGLYHLGERVPIYSLVGDHESRLARSLETRGFAPEASFCALVKQLSVRIRQPRLVPVPS